MTAVARDYRRLSDTDYRVLLEEYEWFEGFGWSEGKILRRLGWTYDAWYHLKRRKGDL